MPATPTFPTPARSHPRTLLLRIGLISWAVQVLYILIELVVWMSVEGPYDLARVTISELGTRGCVAPIGDTEAAPFCSPAYTVANASFVVIGLLMAVGALGVRTVLTHRVLRTVAVAMWVVTGLSWVAAGLIPLHVSLELHVLVSLPNIVTQPLAMLLTAVCLPGRHRVLVWTGLLCGAVGVVAAIPWAPAFLDGELPALSGLLQRVPIWAGYLWLTAVALTLYGQTMSRSGSK